MEQTLTPAQAGEPLELDELWSFVGRRRRKRWVWLALCRRSRQVVAYAIGDRGQKTCRLLWGRIPAASKAGLVFTDFWDAYQTVVPQGQHRATGKGEKVHLGLQQTVADEHQIIIHFRRTARQEQPRA